MHVSNVEWIPTSFYFSSVLLLPISVLNTEESENNSEMTALITPTPGGGGAHL